MERYRRERNEARRELQELKKKRCGMENMEMGDYPAQRWEGEAGLLEHEGFQKIAVPSQRGVELAAAAVATASPSPVDHSSFVSDHGLFRIREGTLRDGGGSASWVPPCSQFT